MNDPRDREAERARLSYESRDADPAVREYWAQDNPGAAALREARDAAVIRVLRDAGVSSLSGWSVADFGCGRGDVLAMLLSLGLAETDAFGIDISEPRVLAGRRSLPAATLVVGPADSTGLPDATQDMALQFTLFSSVLDLGVRRRIAREMDRVLKPGGRVLWFDVRPPTTSLRLVFLLKRLSWWLIKGLVQGRPFPRDPGYLAYHSLAAARGLFPGYELIGSRSACLSRDVVEVGGPTTRLLAAVADAYPPFRVNLIALFRKPDVE